MTKRAIIHVENTDNVLELAEYLSSAGWTIISANKTEDFLRKNKIPVVREPALIENNLYINDTSQLIRHIVLSRYNEEESYTSQMNAEENNIFLVCMNVTPVYEKEANLQQLKNIAKPYNYYVTTLLRNAFTNYENVLILTDPADYKEAIVQLRTDNISEKFRMYLAAKALNLVSAVDSGIAASILENKQSDVDFMNYMTFPFQKFMTLHGGTNTQQTSCLYKYPSDSNNTGVFLKVQGKELTYSIISDVSLAWEQISTLFANLKTQYSTQSTNCDGYDFITQFTPLTGTVFTIAVKNKSIVGAALSTSVLDSLNKTYTYDTDNIIDATLGCSAVIDENAAAELVKCHFAAIVAPGFTAEAKEILSANKNIRLIPTAKVECSPIEGQFVNGGVLLQSKDNVLFEKWNVRTKNRPSQNRTDQMAFGTLLTMGARSFSAVLLKENTIVGISQGCPSSLKAITSVLDEAEQYMKRQGLDTSLPETKFGEVLISDAEIPFCEAVKKLIEKGVTAIIQKGGTACDQEFIDYCNENGVVMVFTGMTHISL